ncbi:MAG: N-acetylneuraminate synthase [Gammaproteobacteria bacterium RIFCSPHIGHO2_12_FULL_37_14]|nr:MAG: N-acetylneuraminate synthase [Gammaproteobacteria bacterium RIFCSPHIGHO2_12_FULL_37_14]
MRTFIIAEAGVNHNGSLVAAKHLVDVAVDAGADAVKFQAFHTEDMICVGAAKAEYQKAATFASESQYDMLNSLELSEEYQIELVQYCKKRSILCVYSPFDLKSVDFLNHSLDPPLIKVASGEITNLPLLLRVARTRKRVVLSTGMSTLGEIETALAILAFGYVYPSEGIDPINTLCEEAYCSEHGQEMLRNKVSLLHCTSEYPAPFAEINLRVMKTLQVAFGLPVGYSDHTLGIAVAIAAVACGAVIIEKHFTLDKSMPGPDHQASLEPHELSAMIVGIRQVELALGDSRKIPSPSEFKNRFIARKSLVSVEKINTGNLFTDKNISCKRPGTGVSPVKFYEYLNKRAERDYDRDELIGI